MTTNPQPPPERLRTLSRLLQHARAEADDLGLDDLAQRLDIALGHAEAMAPDAERRSTTVLPFRRLSS